MTRLLVPLLLLTAAGSSPAAAADLREPTARWVVNYDDAQCIASRNYGTADKPLFLALKPSVMGSVMRITLMRKGTALEAAQRPAQLQFDGGPPIALEALTFGDRETRHFVAMINVPMATFAANRRATSISIKGATFDERLSVPGLLGIGAAFDDCLANLREVWNVGERHARGIKQGARPLRPLYYLFNSASYPLLAAQEDNRGRVGISLLIDEVGKVRDCMVEESSGYASLDAVSCQIIAARAKFAHAVGADGRPAKSASYQRIDWKIRL